MTKSEDNAQENDKAACSGNASSTAKPDVVGELEQLGKLRETGMISEDEFQAMKAKLLFS